MQKVILSELMSGTEVILLDNADANREHQSDVLAQILTSSFFEARKLGTNDMSKVATNITLIATGKNLRFRADLRSDSRRLVRHRRGRGGTSFCPPFEAAFLRQHRPELIIYFTDGFGSAPDNAPRIPVVWCLTPNGQTPATWGRVIQMTDHAG